jgi:hypothetical protein
MKNEDNEHLFHDLFKGSLNASTEHVTSRLNGKMTLFDEKKKQNSALKIYGFLDPGQRGLCFVAIWI